MVDVQHIGQCRVEPCAGHTHCECEWPRKPAYHAVFGSGSVICAQTRQHAHIGLMIVETFCQHVTEHPDYVHNRRNALRESAAEMLAVRLQQIDNLPTGDLVKRVVLELSKGKAQLRSLHLEQRLSSRLCDK